MNMIPPITITDAIFDDSSITEPSSSEANGVTFLTIVDSSCVEANGTYALIFAGGAPLAIATGTYTISGNVITTIHLIYGGLEYTATPTVATQTGDGHIDATWADSNYRGEWGSGETYSVNAIVSVIANHKLYKSLQNGNIGYIPGGAGNALWWLDYGATERWKVFDAKVGSQAMAADLITYEIDPGSIDSVAILNLEAANVTVTMSADGEDDVVWMEDTLIDGLFVSDIVKTDFPLYANPHLLIEIEYSGGTAKVGETIVGLKETLGTMKYNPAVSIIDYSIKQVDDFGNYTVLERAYSKRLSCEIVFPNTQLDEIYNILAGYRARPAVWVGSEDYASLIVYGFYKDFSIAIPYLIYSICTLEIEGLV